MNSQEIKLLYGKIKGTIAKNSGALPSNCYFLSKENVLVLPNPYGDSRHPYTRDGLTLWAYSSGYISVNETDFYIIPITLEGKEPYLSYFGGILNKKNQYDYFSITGSSDTEFGKEKVEKYVVFTPTSALYLRVVNKVIFYLETSINASKEIITNLGAINLSKKDVDVYLSSYINPLIMHTNYECEETKWFRTSIITKYGALIKSVEDVSREIHLHNYLVIKRSGVTPQHVTSSRMFYVGDKNGQLATSRCLKQGHFDIEKQVSTFIDMAVYGDINKKHLAGKESYNIALRMSALFDEKAVEEKEKEPFSEEDVAKDFQYLKEEYKKEFSNSKNRLVLDFKGLHHPTLSDETFNDFLYQVINQVDYCCKAKNSSVMMLGVRDVAQMLEAMCMWNPKYVKEKLLYIFDYIYNDERGRVPRQVGSFDANGMALVDSRNFIDQGQWLITTVYKYLCYTNDYSILKEKCGYVKYVDARHVKKDKEVSTLFEHLKDIIEYLISKIDPETKCLRTLFGDWNDAVDGLGRSNKEGQEYGNGVSMMATFHFYENLNEFIAINDKLGVDSSRYHKIQDELVEGAKKYGIVSKGQEKKIVHGWGEDRSFYVGSFDDVDHKSRNSSTSNSFYIISSFYKKDPSLIPHVLKAFEALDSEYGYKTFDKYFDRKDAYKVGRIVNLPEGTAENAATYVHAAVFAFKALSMIKESELAYTQLLKLIPITHKEISTSPFVMPNSYGHNDKLGIDGQSMNDWYTGSSNTILKGLVESFIGINPQFENEIKLEPNKLPIDEVRVEVSVTGKRIKYHQVSSKGLNSQEIKVNGALIAGGEIKTTDYKGKVINIEVKY